jgi:Fic family protein
MIFAEPELRVEDYKVLGLIREQRERLRFLTQSNPRRWMGTLRKSTFARAIQGSNTIEGYNATMDEAMAAVEEDEPPLDEKTETWLAINGYRSAMTYVMQAADDPYFEFSKQFLKSLHFMMTQFDLSAQPGQWRRGSVYVVNRASGDVVYEAPDVEMVDPLICELVSYLEEDEHSSSVVTAAMAHLNLTMIHPFKDGNGRMARALQTLMLAKEGILHPLFCSIEEWLGRNTEGYYKILAEVGQGKWNPQNDALPWIRFCLTAHYQQSNTLIRRLDEYEKLYEAVNKLVIAYRLHERTAIALFEAALSLRMTNSRYQKMNDVSQHIAGRDLKALVDAGLLEPFGEKRGRYYLASRLLKDTRGRARLPKPVLDPYKLPEVFRSESEPTLPGL